MNLISTFLDTASRVGGRLAIVSGSGETITFSDLAQRSGRLATAFSRNGVKRDDRVLVAMPVGIGLYAAIAALWRLGATIVFPEPAMGLTGVKRAAEIARPDAVLTTGIYSLLPWLVPELWRVPLRLGEDFSQLGDTMEDVSADHPGLISFTSGSTGIPKAIVRSHGFLAAQNAALNPLIAPGREDEVDLVAFPVFVIANLSLGITSVLPNWRLSRPDRARPAAIADQIRTQNITRALVPPSICETMAEAPAGFGLDTIFTGGGPVFPDLLERLARAHNATRIVSVYGSTEAEPIAHQAMEEISAAQWSAMKSGRGLLAGRPLSDVRMRIIEDEIVVTGDHINKGYLDGLGDADNKLRLDGEIWHRTGDAGALDDDGLLWLRGRLSARAGGVYPFEVEVAARYWPGVRRVALIPAGTPPVLAIEGAEPQPGAWDGAAEALGVTLARMPIPLDRRHRSKVDYGRLGQRLR